MARLFFGLALCALLVLCPSARAAVVFTYAEATAQTSGIVGNGSWSGSQFQPIPTPTAGESATATVTRTATGSFGAGGGMTTSVLSLNTQGVTGTMNQSASITANTSPFGIAVVGSNSGGLFVDFTLNASHNFSVVAGGHLNAPDSPDDQLIGVQIQLIRNSSGAMPVDYLQEAEGAITLNQSGLIAAGSYSLYAAMANLFEFDSAPAGVYAGDAELTVSLVLTAIPESSSFTLAALAAIASCGTLWRKCSRRPRR
jgi:hypothetical protein